MKIGLRVGLTALCCCAAACSNNNVVGSKYAKSQLVQALQGGNVAVASSDDVTLAGTSISIPPDALAQDTVVTIAEGDALTLPAGASVAGPVVDLGPAATAFAHPVTVVIPFVLSAGQATTGLAIQGVDVDGATISVSNGDLLIDANAGTVAFTAATLIRFGPIWLPGPTVCPPGEDFCGCCGNGHCLPAGQACPLLCPAIAGAADPALACRVHGSCCPAGEYFCGCGPVGQCIPLGKACPLACPAQNPSATGAAPAAVCCPPHTYLCGCGGEGICIPDDKACPVACPVCDPPNTVPTPCGCLPPGATCDCDPTHASTVPCQCLPPAAGSNMGPICKVDGGSVCPPPEVISPCGCIPPGAMCVPPPDAGQICPSPTQLRCCDGQCVEAGQACPNICFADGGSGAVDGGVCPSTTARCKNGTCVPAGQPCPP